MRTDAAHAERMRLPRFRRYSAGARVYDAVSGERPVYRPSRLTGIERADLVAGSRVLDLGFGTGLSLAVIQRAIGPTGTIVGVDGSPAMLRAARDRCGKFNWTNVDLRQGDAGRLGEMSDLDPPFDAVAVMYALSIIREWRAEFEQSLILLRSGGPIVVVDMLFPTGWWRLFGPPAALVFAVGWSPPTPSSVASRPGADGRFPLRDAARWSHPRCQRDETMTTGRRRVDYDLVVIGGGTAGIVGAKTAASFGARVVLVERGRTGGDCLWTGCVPSKATPRLAVEQHHPEAPTRIATRSCVPSSGRHSNWPRSALTWSR